MKKIGILIFIVLGISIMWCLKNYDLVNQKVNNIIVEDNVIKNGDIENIILNNEEILEPTPVKEETKEVVEPTSVKEETKEILEPTPVKEETKGILEPTSVKEETKEILEPTSVKEETKEVVELTPVKEEMKEAVEPTPVKEVIAEIDLNDPNFELVATSLDLETLKQYNLPILIDFGAEGCVPCQMMYPALEELNKELRGKVIIKFIDVWEYPKAAKGFDFSLIPTQYFFDKEGNQYLSHTGILSKENILKTFKEMGMEE